MVAIKQMISGLPLLAAVATRVAAQQVVSDDLAVRAGFANEDAPLEARFDEEDDSFLQLRDQEITLEERAKEGTPSMYRRGGNGKPGKPGTGKHARSMYRRGGNGKPGKPGTGKHARSMYRRGGNGKPGKPGTGKHARSMYRRGGNGKPGALTLLLYLKNT
ncbi:unnamed protein product [Clonostachys solani]|uniref:Uncharacterized protein n=1 Tax=Clonostachys solani TaxID=160281 RepID=A0A9P0ENI7_9HYPO|nr:unnamed protein product [Clonostachys solani]